MNLSKRIVTAFLIITAFSACNSNNNKNKTVSTVKSTPQYGIQIKNAWIRPANAGMNSALFFTIINNSNHPDTLYSASSPLAQVIELHETYHKGADVMGMRHVDMVPIPSLATIEFKPRDLHVMLIKLKKDIVVSDSGDVVLLLKKAGNISIRAEIRDMPPGLR